MSAAGAMMIFPDSELPAPEERAAVAQPRDAAAGQAPPQHAVRYERGSQVYATDGLVGTLRQVVIDEEMGEVKALVVQMAAKKELVLVPPDLVDKSAAGALLLNVTKAQFAAGASRSPRFSPRMFTAADRRRVSGAIPLVFRGDWRRSLVSIAADHVETSEALAPASEAQPSSTRRPWWKRLGRR